MTALSTLPPSPARVPHDVFVVGKSARLRAVEEELRERHVPVRAVADVEDARAQCGMAARPCVFVMHPPELKPAAPAPEWEWLQDSDASVLFVFETDEVERLHGAFVACMDMQRVDFVRAPASRGPAQGDQSWLTEALLRVRKLADAGEPKREPGLFDPETGRYDAARVADFLRVPLKDVAAALGAKYQTVHKTPSGVALQEGLGRIGRSIELLLKFHGSSQAARAWLNTPHRELGERTPMSVILGGRADVVRDMLDAAYAGLPT